MFGIFENSIRLFVGSEEACIGALRCLAAKVGGELVGDSPYWIIWLDTRTTNCLPFEVREVETLLVQEEWATRYYNELK